MQFLDILYLVLWAGIGAYCFSSARKLGAILYVIGGFFVFMFGWRLIHALLPVDLYGGVYGIVFRCIAAVFLIVIVLLYLKVRHKKQ